MEDIKANTITVAPPPKWLSTPVFVTLLLEDTWNERLRIPPDFVNLYIHEFQATHPNTVLQTTRGNWNVSKDFRRGGKVYLNHGWTSFVTDNNLVQGKLLVFYAASPNLFHVSLLNEYGCGTFMSPTLHSPPPVWRNLPIALKECQKYYINLPISFMKKTGLFNEDSIMLLNPKGLGITVGIRKCRLGPGWIKFCRLNGYVSGDSCLLRCLTDNAGTLVKTECYKV